MSILGNSAIMSAALSGEEVMRWNSFIHSDLFGAGVGAEERGPELAEGGVVAAPTEADERQHGIELLGHHAAGRRPSSGKGSNQDELGDTLGMASRIGCADGAALATANQCELVKADGRDEFLEVRERALEGKVVDIPVGEAAAALVITKQSVVAHDLREPVPAIGVLPLKVEVVEPIDGAHQGRAASADGVGESHTVAGGEELDFLLGWRVSGWRGTTVCAAGGPEIRCTLATKR